MKQEELKTYQQTPPADPFWVHNGLKYKGETFITLALFHDWFPMPLWGSEGYNLGSWPFMIICLKDRPDGSFDIAYHEDGEENIVYRAPSEAIRDQIVDTLAFNCWKQAGEPWVEGIETPEALPDRCKGPFSKALELVWPYTVACLKNQSEKI